MSLRLQARSNTNLKDRSILERGYNFDNNYQIDSDDIEIQKYYNFNGKQPEKNMNSAIVESNYLYEIVPYKPKSIKKDTGSALLKAGQELSGSNSTKIVTFDGLHQSDYDLTKKKALKEKISLADPI